MEKGWIEFTWRGITSDKPLTREEILCAYDAFEAFILEGMDDLEEDDDDAA